jgi:hypothetical protein
MTTDTLTQTDHDEATEIRKQMWANQLADIAAARAAGATDDDIRQALAGLYGPIWNTDELIRDFEAIGFAAPLVVVRRRSDGVKGSLRFINDPRTYFSFEPHHK